MAQYQDIRTLPDSWAVVDLDTGTVLGTNLLIVRDFPEDVLDESDSVIADHALVHGVSMYMDIYEKP